MSTDTMPGDPAHVAGKPDPTNPTAGRTISIDGVTYSIDTSKYKRIGLPAVREGVASGEPSDSLFDHTGSWWRERHDWSHGAGQQLGDFGDPGNTSDTRQFYTSRCVDVWNKLELRLHKKPDLLVADAVANNQRVMDVGGTLVYAVGSGGMKYSNSTDITSGTSWSSLSMTGFGISGTQVYDFCTDGQQIYAVDGVGAGGLPFKTALGLGTWSALGDGSTECYNIFHVAGRLIGGGIVSNLFEIGVSTVTPIYTAGNTPSGVIGGGVGFRWSTVFAVGSKIYAGGYINNKSYLYSLTSLSDGTLARSDEAADFQAGEILLGGYSYAGVVILVSSLGVRLAVTGGGGTLTYGPLISDFGRCSAATFEGRYAYVTCYNYPASDGGTTYVDNGVVRLDLAEFTDQLLPSYAADIRYTPSSHTTANMPSGIARYNSKTFVFFPAVGLVGESSASVYESTGWVNSGDMYFGTTETKRALSTIVRHAALPSDNSTSANVAVQVTVTDQEGTTLGDHTNSTIGSNGIALDLDGALFDHLNVKLTLTSAVADTTVAGTPQVRVWNTRAFPVPATTQNFTVPLILTSKVVRGGGQGMITRQDIERRRDRIIALWAAKQVVTYREGSNSYRVRIDNFEIDLSGWTDSGDEFEMLLTVSLMTV